MTPDQRSTEGQRNHKLQILSRLQRKRGDEELEQIIESLETNDTWNGYQGPPKPPPKMDAGTEPEPVGKIDACCETDTVVAQKVDAEIGTDTVPEKITMDTGISTDQPMKTEVETETDMPQPMMMHSVEVGTDPAPEPETAPPTKIPKVGKLLPKKNQMAVNENSEIVDPNKLVEWTRILVPLEQRVDVLHQLAQEPHIKTRIPQIELIREQAMAKFRDTPAMQVSAAEFNLSLEEAHVLLACPRHRCTFFVVHSIALPKDVACVVINCPSEPL